MCVSQRLRTGAVSVWRRTLLLCRVWTPAWPTRASRRAFRVTWTPATWTRLSSGTHTQWSTTFRNGLTEWIWRRRSSANCSDVKYLLVSNAVVFLWCVLSMFSCCSSFDWLLFWPTGPANSKSAQDLLRCEIVNPLRRWESYRVFMCLNLK